MQFLCTFRKTWWHRMLKTVSKEQIRCRCCFFEEIKAIGVEKMHQILTEIDKNTKKTNFEKFMQLLCIFRKTWWLRMLKIVSKEQIRCHGCFFEEIKATGVEKMHQILTEIDKNTKKSNFENFMQFLCKFGKPWQLKISKTFNKEQIGCQEGFFRKQTKFCNEKNAQFW